MKSPPKEIKSSRGKHIPSDYYLIIHVLCFINTSHMFRYVYLKSKTPIINQPYLVKVLIGVTKAAAVLTNTQGITPKEFK